MMLLGLSLVQVHIYDTAPKIDKYNLLPFGQKGSKEFLPEDFFFVSRAHGLMLRSNPDQVYSRNG